MPHIIIKLISGRSEQQKKRLTKKIIRDVVAIANCRERSVSVAIEDVAQEDWPEAVYKMEILRNKARLYKLPGYNPFA